MSSFVERVIDESLFMTGALSLGPAEVTTLGLPKHPVSIQLEHRDGVALVSWQSGPRQLVGEALLDLIEVHGQVDGLLRLHPPEQPGQSIGLQFIERPAAGPRYHGSAEVLPKKSVSKPARPGAGRARGTRAVDRQKIRDRSDFEWVGPVGIGKESVASLNQNLKAAGWDDPAQFELRVDGEQLAAVTGFDELLALEIASVDHMPHQEATALKVLGRLRGRAILADEVGLGKTIEAGLILKELILRGMASRILVVCPATLRDQWRDELSEKFHEEFHVALGGKDLMSADLLIMSRRLATQEVDQLAPHKWDLLIVDEAHRMAGPGARKSREFLQRIDSRYALYLTATPVQNDLLELYRLVDTLRPGTFASQRDFTRRFMGSTPREPRDPAALRRLIADVMVRTTRAQAGLDRIARIPRDYPITLSAPERRAYDLCVTTLRHHMNGRDDHLRRRHLAHRLTTSPRALGQSARRMAATVSDPQARVILEELADLCAEFGITSRQKKLLSLVTDWVDDPDKGRVLVFTQHTDTLEDLLRVLDTEGVAAVAFHGGMSPKAKQAAIQSFRAGKKKGVPVMVSTESGAEGLNLQFANCVVNYDLPWNPMRIEQRIGRVHRVTQKRDVYVANFFARDTIDESVYRLLHDKLRMFELLFGQVTTILGELDDDGGNASSFDTRILDALVATDDSTMERRLDELGAKVDAAYESAQHQMQTGAGNLTSLIFDTSHRKGMAKDGARELAPDAVIRDRQRRMAVESFVRRYLEVIGADISWDSPGTDSEPGFISARVPEEAQAGLGERSELNIAFGGDAMAQHADAELCAVGTEIFEQIIDSLADRGDLVAHVPDERLLKADTPWFTGSEGLRFLNRELEPIADWAGEAVWRVRSTTDRDGDDVISTHIGDPVPGTHTRPLTDGEALPAVEVGRVLDRVIRASQAQLREVAEVAQRDLDEASTQESARMQDYYRERLSELRGELDRLSSWSERRADLQGQITRLAEAGKRVASQGAPLAEVEADLIAVRLAAPPVVTVRETWASGDGATFTVRFPWDMRKARPMAFKGADGLPVRLIARCSDGHVVDAANLCHCPGCGVDRCGRCDGGSSFGACVACGTGVCSQCLPDVLCLACASPVIEQPLTSPALIELGHGALATVSHQKVVIDRADGTQLELLTSLGIAAQALGPYQAVVAALGAEVGVLRGREAPHEPSSDEAEIRAERKVEWRILPQGGPSIDASAVAMLWPAANAQDAQSPAGATPEWVEALVRRAELAPGPAIIVETVVVVRSLLTQDGALVVRDRTIRPVGAEVAVDHPTVLDPGERTLSAPGLTLKVDRVHRSFVARGLGEDPLVIGDGRSSSTDDLALAEVAAEHGSVEGVVLSPRARPALQLAAARDGVELVHRSVESIWSLSEADELQPLLEWPSQAARPDVPRHRALVAPQTHAGLDAGLAAPTPIPLELRYRVTETWRSSWGEAHLDRVLRPDESGLPLLDDTGREAADFEIDSVGHLHEVGAGWICPSCDRARCGGCGPTGQIGSCTICAQDACGECRAHDGGDVTSACVVCNRANCTACGSSVALDPCALCQRLSCGGCQFAGTCATCRSLRLIDDAERESLPDTLVARVGGSVMAGEDEDGTVVVICAGARLELALIDPAGLRQWSTAATLTEEELGLLLAAGRELGGIAAMELVTDVRPWLAPDGDELVVLADDREALALLVTDPVTSAWELLDQFDCVGATSSASPADLARLALAARFPEAQPLPTPCDADQAAILRSISQPISASQHGRVLRVTGTTRIHRSAVGASGLVLTAGVFEDARVEVAEWRSPSPDERTYWEGLTGGVLVETVAAAGATAALMTMGPCRLLTVHTSAGIHCHRVDDEPGYPALIGLAAWLGTGDDRFDVVDCVVPDDEPRVWVTNATLVSREWKPLVEEAPEGTRSDTSAISRLMGVLSAPAIEPLVQAANADLPAGLRVALDGRMTSALGAERRSLQVGFRAEDVWSTPAGAIAVRYERRPGDLRSTIDASPGRVLGPVILVDRAGHLADVTTTCPYCDTDTCDACEDRTMACMLCGQLVCGRCDTTGEGVCPACASAERVGLLGRQRISGHPSLALRGKDRLHAVVVVPAGGGTAMLTITRDGDTQQMTRRVPAALAAQFDRLTKSTAFT